MSTIIDYASVPNGELFPLSSLTKRIAELEAERDNLLRRAESAEADLSYWRKVFKGYENLDFKNCRNFVSEAEANNRAERAEAEVRMMRAERDEARALVNGIAETSDADLVCFAAYCADAVKRWEK